jgi:hypothetical protein
MQQTAIKEKKITIQKQSAWLKAASLVSREGASSLNQLLDLKLKFPSLNNSSRETPDIAEFHQIEAALKIISAKAAALSGLAGAQISDVELVPTGYVVHYQGCDIYYSSATGAHEVHGDIKAKYDALLGSFGTLGLPITDESDVGDGAGRYNHFVNGSIYWTAHTGPMMMLIPIRDFWLNHGAQSTLGYPVYDQHQEAPNVFPPVDPHVAWCGFENGAVVQSLDGIAQALTADLSPDDLRKVVRGQVDAQFHASPDNVGLQPNVETVGIGNWALGFWASVPRDITFNLHGFHDNGLAPDTNFTITIGLRFELVWPMQFGEPASKTLVAWLDFLRVVHDDGADDLIPVVPGQVVKGVGDGIYKAFFPDAYPNPEHPEVPFGAVFVADAPSLGGAQKGIVDVIGVIPTAAGGLQVLVNPLPTAPINWGLARQNAAQNAINSLIP